MPSQRRNRMWPENAPVATDAPLPSTSGTPRRVFVFGAGVDITFGVPAMSTLLRDLAAFAKNDGLPIHQALRKRLPNLRFTFDRYAGDQSNEMLRQLFSSDNQDLVDILRTTAEGLQQDPAAAPIGALIERLCTFAENNQLSGVEAAGVVKFAGIQADVSGGEAILDPEHIVLTNPMAQGLRQAFVQALEDDDPFDQDQRKRIEYFVEATSNVEQLMSLYFTRYLLGRPADQKTFLYIVWMLWAFLRIKSHNPPIRANSIYSRLPQLAGEVITFNYTNFFGKQVSRVTFFHGHLGGYIQLDDRELVTDTPLLRAATDVGGIVELVNAVRLEDLAGGGLDIPALVPPTKFKPVMSREQLLTWAKADRTISQATTIVVVGYSFALADEHFNDLLRHALPQTRFIVINPDIVTASREASRVLGIDASTLVEEAVGVFSVRRAGRLVCIAAKAEDVTDEFLTLLG